MPKARSCYLSMLRNCWIAVPCSAPPTFTEVSMIVWMCSQRLGYFRLRSLLSTSQVDLNNEVNKSGHLVTKLLYWLTKKGHDRADMTHPRPPQREALMNIETDQCFHLKWSECVFFSDTCQIRSVMIKRWASCEKLPQQVALTALSWQVNAIVRVLIATHREKLGYLAILVQNIATYRHM